MPYGFESFLLNMIYINRNSLNKVVLTLSESVTITNPYFIFSFQEYNSLGYPVLRYFIAPDTSLYTDRYNLFLLTESDTGSKTNANNASIYLKPGQYCYKVYQSTSNSFDPNTFGSLLESGRMVVGDICTPDQDTAVASVYR